MYTSKDNDGNIEVPEEKTLSRKLTGKIVLMNMCNLRIARERCVRSRSMVVPRRRRLILAEG
jgi:hypothetical protein